MKKLIAVWVAMVPMVTHAGSTDSATLSGLEAGGAVHQLSARLNNRIQSVPDALFDDAKTRGALIMLHLQSGTDVEVAKRVVNRAMQNGIDLLLEGKSEWLRQLKPDDQTVWAGAELLFVSNRSERRGLYFLRLDPPQSLDKLMTLVSDTRTALSKERPSVYARSAQFAATTARTAPDSRVAQTWKINLPTLTTQTPSEVCLTIRNELAKVVPSDSLADVQINQLVGKVCQYGTVSDFSAQSGDRIVPGYGNVPVGSDLVSDLLVNMREEWLYLVSADPYQPSGSRAYLWLRTLGEGAGTGFTRKGAVGRFYPLGSASFIARIMHPVIHSGWGPMFLDYQNTWKDGKPDMLFGCERDSSSFLPLGDGKQLACPVKPRLLSLFPSNSYSDSVDVASSQSWNISGTLTVGGGGRQGGVTGNASLALSGGYSNTKTESVSLSLQYTATNTDTVYYRSTEWQPNWKGMFSWHDATGIDSLVNATALAGTLNPNYSIVWQIPLVENAGRVLQFGSIYENRMQSCAASNVPNCPSEVPGTNPPWKEDYRVLWTKNSDLLLFP